MVAELLCPFVHLKGVETEFAQVEVEEPASSVLCSVGFVEHRVLGTGHLGFVAVESQNRTVKFAQFAVAAVEQRDPDMTEREWERLWSAIQQRKLLFGPSPVEPRTRRRATERFR